MTSWIALLRGVNVGGATVRNAELREIVTGIGGTDVVPVLASGNVVFDHPTERADAAALRARLEAALGRRYDYDAHLLLVAREAVEEAIGGFPFAADDTARQPWVIFCDTAQTAASLIDEPRDDDLDPVARDGAVVYWNPPKGRSTDTPFAKAVARRTWRERTTTRNLRTLVKILAARP
ncbi:MULTISPECIES: DUF1697 domain-containing protein [Microbacterium]|uniref:DUF1697 domain-containing protein n=1 Tax=Microbacterium TaxID=33882 RepID=UPI0010F58038|nr:DUF1697 domain-containing protein [Microbacterium sp. 4NA327F11]MCK9916425.1 DUF1697 domain-containing protein [Microbacteriaceae bacterium K1510]